MRDWERLWPAFTAVVCHSTSLYVTSGSVSGLGFGTAGLRRQVVCLLPVKGMCLNQSRLGHPGCANRLLNRCPRGSVFQPHIGCGHGCPLRKIVSYKSVAYPTKPFTCLTFAINFMDELTVEETVRDCSIWVPIGIFTTARPERG